MSTPIKVGVVGAGGRMGATVCGAVAADPALRLVAAVDPKAVGQQVHGIAIAGELRALADAGAEVVVDFTVADSARVTLPWLAMHGMHAVVGTTGFTPERLDTVRGWLRQVPSTGVLVAPNFGIGAVLMMHFAAKAAPYFESVEIVELHHPDKADAPSGTATSTARQIAEKREAAERNAQLAKRRKRHTLDDVLKTLEKGEVAELKIIIKGDVSGSVEALEELQRKCASDVARVLCGEKPVYPVAPPSS